MYDKYLVPGRESSNGETEHFNFTRYNISHNHAKAMYNIQEEYH